MMINSFPWRIHASICWIYHDIGLKSVLNTNSSKQSSKPKDSLQSEIFMYDICTYSVVLFATMWTMRSHSCLYTLYMYIRKIILHSSTLFTVHFFYFLCVLFSLTSRRALCFISFTLLDVYILFKFFFFLRVTLRKLTIKRFYVHAN